MLRMQSARAGNEPLSVVERFSQPDTTDDLYCDDDDENEPNDDDESGGDDDSGSSKQQLAAAAAPAEQRRRPSLVIAGDAQALESVRTVHSPKSLRPSVRSEASPKLSAPHWTSSAVKPSPSSTGAAVAPTMSSAPGWRAAWTAKLASKLDRLDLLASVALFVYSYHDCLDEQSECHEECLADPDTTSRPLPLSMAGAAVAMVAVYGPSRPAALLEWAQTAMAVSWIQRMAPLPAVALAASHERHLTLVSDGTAAALAGFLVCRRRHRRDGSARWTLAFLVAALGSGAVDVLSSGGGAVTEPVSVLLGVFVVVAAHVLVATLRSVVGLDGDHVRDALETDAEAVEAKKTK